MTKIIFEYEYVPTIEKLHEQIAKCEGVHVQQAVYSTFHGALTQICYNCLRVRSNIKR